MNRKDPDDKNVFEGGFLGLDNIGVFDRSAPLPTGGTIEQSDGTAWVGMFCLTMLTIALTLALEDPVYEDIASKFFEHFVPIAHAMNNLAGATELWDRTDGFFYDVLLHARRAHHPAARTLHGGAHPPLCRGDPGARDHEPAAQVLGPHAVVPGEPAQSPRAGVIGQDLGDGRTRWLLSLVGTTTRLSRVLGYLLDDNEFLSPFGVRSLSRFHRGHPYVVTLDGHEHRVDYEPAESTTGLFGGNSNWRGPIWFPVNFLIIEALQKFDHFYGSRVTGGAPHRARGAASGSGTYRPSCRAASIRIFLRDENGRRPVHGDADIFQKDPAWRDLILFYEYFQADSGEGLGANHQTGWTGLVAKLLQQSGG